ncbi:MAG: sulfite exporter TauE/SafE family protein [Tabrizicola sp.]
MFELVSGGLSGQAFAVALAVTLFAGFVKGAVGFAMPMILVSAFAVFLPQDLALAGLILPTLVTNLSQAFRQGAGPALDTARSYRRFLLATVVCIALSAPLAEAIPRAVYLLMLGIPISAFAALQLAGRSLAIPLRNRRGAEWALGAVGGLYGGVSGIWGPPLLVLLLSTGADKLTMVRAQGVVFLIGAVALLLSHLGTGIANVASLGFSAALAVPALVGLHAGYRVQDRLDQARFRRMTQALLVVTGLNMVRLALR